MDLARTIDLITRLRQALSMGFVTPQLVNEAADELGTLMAMVANAEKALAAAAQGGASHRCDLWDGSSPTEMRSSPGEPPKPPSGDFASRV